MKHYYFAQYSVVTFGWGHSDESEGVLTVLAESDEQALELARVQIEKEHPRALVTVKIAQTVGY